MATSIRTSQILAGITQFQQTFAAKAQQIGQMRPHEQVIASANQELQTSANQLAEFQQRMAYDFDALKSQIPDLTPEALDIIRQKLRDTAVIRDQFNTNTDIAIGIEETTGKAAQIFIAAQHSSPDRLAIIQLKREVTQLLLIPGINAGNAAALEVAKGALREMLRRQSTQQPPLPQFHPTPVYSPSLQLGTERNSLAPLPKEDRSNRNATETLCVKKLESTYAGIHKNFGKSHSVNFATVENFFLEFQNAHKSNTPYFSPANEKKMTELLNNQVEMLRQILQVQRNEEESKCEKAEEPHSGHASTLPLRALQIALGAAKTAADKESTDGDILFKNVKDAFAKLSSDEKERLYETLYDVLLETKKATKRPVNPGLKRLGLFEWGGSYGDKLAAVNRLLNASTPLPSLPAQASIADDMERRLNNLINGTDNTPEELVGFGNLHVSNNSTSHGGQSAAPQVFGDHGLSDEVAQLLGLSAAPQGSTTPRNNNTQRTPGNLASNGYEEPSPCLLGHLGETRTPAASQRQTSAPMSSVSNKTPIEKVRELQGVLPGFIEGLKAPETKRCFQRAVIMGGLETLESAAQNEDYEGISDLCSFLRSIGMDSRDLLPGETHVVDALSYVIERAGENLKDAVSGIQGIHATLAKIWNL